MVQISCHPVRQNFPAYTAGPCKRTQPAGHIFHSYPAKSFCRRRIDTNIIIFHNTFQRRTITPETDKPGQTSFSYHFFQTIHILLTAFPIKIRYKRRFRKIQQSQCLYQLFLSFFFPDFSGTYNFQISFPRNFSIIFITFTSAQISSIIYDPDFVLIQPPSCPFFFHTL